ncbi:MAG: hypothetical protein OEY59_07770 [Deltaproteobacteria bacterium]|nr:hypothetical protein [Deltaproteobacteria bacterium]
MPHFTLIVCTLMSVVIAFFVLYKPLFMDSQEEYLSQNENEDEFDESISILEALSELEADFDMGKISRDEFDLLSLEYKRDFLDMKKL